jgi:tetratricopeptide (TPR) repeat protein
LGQAGVYSFHNGPEHKPFIDARLELPSEDDFRQYLELESDLNRGGSSWPKMLQDLDDPLLLVLHLSDSAAEASLLSHADWRCIYFDSVGGVFVSRRHPGLQEKYPSVDFAERHFRRTRSGPDSELPRADFQESLALHRIDVGLSDAATEKRPSISLAALGLATRAVADEPDSSAAWKLLGDCYASLARQRGTDLPTNEVWTPTWHLAWAQAAYCARRALESPPRDPDALSTLYSVYASTGLIDAQLAVGLSLVNDPSTTANRREEIKHLRGTVEQIVMGQTNSAAVDPAETIAVCLRSGLPMLAARRYADLSQETRNSLDWDGARAAAAAFLRLGQPAEARAVLQVATGVPSESLRSCRIAETHLVEQEFAPAEESFRQALAADPWLADAWCGLATMYAQQGDAPRTYECCQQGFECDLAPWTRSKLDNLKAIVVHYRQSVSSGVESRR